MPSPIDQFQAMISNLEQLQCQDDGTCNFHYPCAFATNESMTMVMDSQPCHNLKNLVLKTNVTSSQLT